MRFFIRCYSIFLFTSLFSSYLEAQENTLSSEGDGIGTGGTFSLYFGQFAWQTYFEVKSSADQGVQYPFELNHLYAFVPDTIDVTEQMIIQEKLLCFNAQRTLKIAGAGNFVIVQNSTIVELKVIVN
jgi:hypothetical protein